MQVRERERERERSSSISLWGISFPRECLVEQGPSALFTFSSSCLLCKLGWVAPVTVTYVTMTYINRMRGVVALGLILGFALFTSPGVLASSVSLLNCGEAEVTIESLFYTAEDGWVVPGQPIWESVDVPAGSNSDLLSVVEDSAGSFYFWLLSEVPVVIDGVVPKQIELEGTTFTAYEVNTNDFSNSGQVGVLCASNDYTKCELTQAGPDNAKPVQYRTCDD